MKTLTKDMSGIVSSMDSVMKTMNVEKITAVMDKFEQQFENLDLATGVMEQSMQSSTSMTMPETQVEALMQQVADEHGLEFQTGLPGLPAGGVVVPKQQVEEKKESVNIGAGGGSVGGNNNSSGHGKKKGGDDGSSGGGGGLNLPAPPNSSSAADEESLEERLRKLQGGL